MQFQSWVLVRTFVNDLTVTLNKAEQFKGDIKAKQSLRVISGYIAKGS